MHTRGRGPLPPKCGVQRVRALHHKMVALKLQQFLSNLKKNFVRRLWRLVFPMLFCQSDGPPHEGGGLQGGGGGVCCFDKGVALAEGGYCRPAAWQHDNVLMGETKHYIWDHHWP